MADVTRSLKDAAYVAVGFGVLGFQRAQVRRRELARQLQDQGPGGEPRSRSERRSELEAQLAQTRAQLVELGHDLERRLQPALVELGERVEPLMDQLEPHVPDPAKPAWSAVREAARQTREQLRESLGEEESTAPSPGS